jgi:hypothetical protein
MKPPPQIDRAEVVLWAWSEPTPFFDMPFSDGSGAIPIHGLAICRYSSSGKVYRFSCNRAWETENDTDYESVEHAAMGLSQYDINAVAWRRFAE